MWGFWKKTGDGEEFSSIWKNDFSDCIAADYLPGYSICQNEGNTVCRFATRYAGMVLCSNPNHKSFIPEGAAPFDPRRNR